ncbi:MAG: 1-deoxy-D-xylulose-5-phosphate synthase [Lachnospiraceae bacterium]|nr:1-deoxy-D-xylulose-5-phosphate synthase [Lachnospiraceae bacterium]
MGSLLAQIEKPNDIKKIPRNKWKELASEIRQFLVENISETGGHLGSNLGAVELTMALHLCLDLPEDKIIWDVGHQSYTHKILTGRKDAFGTLRKFGGLSGFPKRSESDCDCFDTGHSSTSISAGLGMVHARQLKGENYTVAAVIGDGSITGGLAYEALNNASKINSNFIIILNDNEMSISPNVGGISSYLNEIRTSEPYIHLRDKVFYSINDDMPKVVSGIRRAKNSLKQLMIPGMYFEQLGLTYLGPVDGNDTAAVVRAIRMAKKVNKAVVVHVITKKGKGYLPAERHPARFHGTGPFDIETGLPKHTGSKAGYTNIFSTVMLKLGNRNSDVVAITAAMTDGVGLKRFQNAFPDRFFDVGIAEQHAVTFAAGLAAAGLKPVVAVYSTFLQRAYDQIVHDVCLQDLPVIFAVDRAGLVGADGETHQGIFDLSYLTSNPGMTVMAPKNKWELSDMFKFALGYGHPVAIRYPRGEAYDGLKEHREAITAGKAEMLFDGSRIALFAVGSMVETAVAVREELSAFGYDATVINARFAAPFDRDMLRSLSGGHSLVVTLEENVKSGGFGEHVREFADEENLPFRLLNISIPDRFVEHGSVAILKDRLGLTPGKITERIRQELKEAGEH